METPAVDPEMHTTGTILQEMHTIMDTMITRAARDAPARAVTTATGDTRRITTTTRTTSTTMSPARGSRDTMMTDVRTFFFFFVMGKVGFGTNSSRQS